MSTVPPRYISYLLRLWLAGDNGQPQWRAALTDPLSGEQKGFDSLEELFEFLRVQVTGSKTKREQPDS